MEETFSLFVLLDDERNINVVVGTIQTAKVTPFFLTYSGTVPWTVFVLNGVRSAGSS